MYWTYTVRNAGGIALSGVTVTDADLPEDGYPGGVVCAVETIDVGAEVVCGAEATVHPWPGR